MKNYLLLFFAFLTITTSTFAAKEISPYEMPKKEFAKTIKTIAIFPIQVPEHFLLNDELKASIEAQVVKRLEKEGFDIIPGSVFGQIRQTMTDQVGGVKNPTTGEYDIPKFMAVAEHTQREMLFRHQFDAMVTIKLKSVQAVFANDKAIWDGVEQKVASSGDSILKFITSQKFYGNIWTNSIEVAFFDRTDKLLYINRGGIEPIMVRESKSLVATKPETWFQNQKKIKKAIKIALKPL